MAFNISGLTDAGAVVVAQALGQGGLKITRAVLSDDIITQADIPLLTSVTPVNLTADVLSVEPSGTHYDITVGVDNEGVTENTRFRTIVYYGRTRDAPDGSLLPDDAPDVLLSVSCDETGETVQSETNNAEWSIEIIDYLAISSNLEITISHESKVRATQGYVQSAIRAAITVSEEPIPPKGSRLHFYVLGVATGYTPGQPGMPDPTPPPESIVHGTVMLLEDESTAPGAVEDEQSGVHDMLLQKF